MARTNERSMTISGVALLALCTIAGQFLGESLGHALGVKANVGGVGIAMLLLIGVRWALERRGLWTDGVQIGIVLWGSLYIPIVVAMAAQQDVYAAIEGGPMVLVIAVAAVALCFVMVAAISRRGRPRETMDDIDAALGLEPEGHSAATPVA